jgi:hypothetical protein
MLIDLITIVIFGLLGYMIAQVPKTGALGRLEVSLVILVILAGNMHGAFGFIGIGDFRMYLSSILQGIMGGILIKRMLRKAAQTA